MSRTRTTTHRQQPGCLALKLQRCTESLKDTLEEFADRICYDVTCEFQNFQRKVTQWLELSDYVTDDVAVELTQKLVEVVCVGFYKTAQRSFRKTVLDLVDSLNKIVRCHWNGKMSMYLDDTFDYTQWHFLFSEAHKLLRVHCAQAEDVYKMLEASMSEVTCQSRALLLQELREVGTENRDTVKARAASELQTLLTYLEPLLIHHIGSVFDFMDEVLMEMEFVALEHISQS